MKSIAACLSVGIPLYNKSSTVLESLISIEQQTIFPSHVIIVDDKSTDRSLEVVYSYIRKKRYRLPYSMRVHESHINQGVSATRNIILEHAITQYIAFLDADDVFLPNHIQSLQDMADLWPNHSLYCTAYLYQSSINKIRPIVYLNDQKTRFDFIGPSRFAWLEQLYHNRHMVTSSSVMLNSMTPYRFDENISSGEDLFLWYSIALSDGVVYSAIPSSIYRDQALVTGSVHYPYDRSYASKLPASLFESDPKTAFFYALIIAKVFRPYLLRLFLASIQNLRRPSGSIFFHILYSASLILIYCVFTIVYTVIVLARILFRLVNPFLERASYLSRRLRLLPLEY